MLLTLTGAGVAVGSGVAVGLGVAVGIGVAVGAGVAVGFGVAVGAGVAVHLWSLSRLQLWCCGWLRSLCWFCSRFLRNLHFLSGRVLAPFLAAFRVLVISTDTILIGLALF